MTISKTRRCVDTPYNLANYIVGQKREFPECSGRGYLGRSIVKAKLVILLILILGFGGALYLSDWRVDKSDGWRSLFDGNSLTGWASLNGNVPGSGWKAQNGVLTSVGHTGDLVTIDKFGDFELSLDWKVSKGANSGIIYRVGPGDQDAFQTGPEYQILDNLNAEDRQPPNHRAGSLYDIAAPSQDLTKPVGRWNNARIVVRGWKIEHWLNGQKIVDVDLASPQGKALIANSKFAGSSQFASFLQGRIALQDHGDVVSFRAIKIRDLGKS